MGERLRSLQVTYKFTTGKRFEMKTLVMVEGESLTQFLRRVDEALRADLN